MKALHQRLNTKDVQPKLKGKHVFQASHPFRFSPQRRTRQNNSLDYNKSYWIGFPALIKSVCLTCYPTISNNNRLMRIQTSSVCVCIFSTARPFILTQTTLRPTTNNIVYLVTKRRAIEGKFLS